MNEYSSLVRQPISEEQPCGQDVRDEPEFGLLQVEISKMSNPAAGGAPEWQRVVELSCLLLATKGKDVLVACHLANGLLQTRGLAGLCDGLQILADLMLNWWNQLHPPLQRLRARRNAMQWLIDQVRAHCDEHDWAALPQQDPSIIDALCTAIDAIDALLAENDCEAPSLQPMRAQIKRIPVEAVAIVPKAEPPSTPALGAAVALAELAQPASLAAAPAPVPAAVQPIALESAETIGLATDIALGRLADIGGWFAEAEPDNALGFRLRRIAAWAGIESAPPAPNGQTTLPRPIAQLQDALQSLLTREADADVVQFTEMQLRQFPLWFDLQYAAVGALGRLGRNWEAAQREVSNETAKLVDRFPGIEQLKFAGGMPFAGSETLRWLETLSTSANGPASSASADPLQQVLQRSRALALDNDMAGAADCLQQAMQQYATPSARLRLHTVLCELLFQHQPRARLDAFARALTVEIDRCNACTWDPLQAVDGLRAAWAILSRNDENRAESDSLLSRIASLNAALAVRLIL